MSGMTIVEFLAAGLDEDEAAWQGGLNLQTRPDFSRLSEKMLADVQAKRRIVQEWRQVDELDERKTSPAWARMTRVMWFLALPYADHPDYEPDWAPSAA